MIHHSQQSGSEDAWFTFDLPIPVDKEKKVEVPLLALQQLIAGRALFLSQRQETKFLYTTSSFQNMHLVFSEPWLRATVKIPTNQQLDFLTVKRPRKSSSMNLFSDEDEAIQETVEGVIKAIESIQSEVHDLSSMVHDAQPELVQSGLEALAEHPNAAMRSFVVRGGSFAIDVDGHAMTMQAEPLRRSLVDSETCNLLVRLQPATSMRGGYFDAKILAVTGVGRKGVAVGAFVRLGFLTGFPTIQAYLLLARELDQPVYIEARFASSVESKSLLTGEVLAIHNAVEILQASQNALLKHPG